ncbi:S24 family peptidase [uncultured Sphingomonas sp.]|uniref:S24 family peptidase n=1 Tax=uncultured Sphingomonas sp. TaxID=158754 RepID=UPI0025CBDC85|nr:S24 family peptidase [uncultured Sphingomonas sp.]
MTDEEARAALETLVRERREDYAGLSRLLGRNPAYVQQYVRRGSPRRLAEGDRRTLARYFGVADSALGGPVAQGGGVVPARDAAKLAGGMIAIPRLAVGAAAGPGALPGEEQAVDDLYLSTTLLRELGVGRPAALQLIRVEGDSMQPTLAPGDDILVDHDDAAARLRPGIYVLRRNEGLLVKRVELNPSGGIDIRSDNDSGGSWTNVDPGSIDIIGRVIWAGRRIR